MIRGSLIGNYKVISGDTSISTRISSDWTTSAMIPLVSHELKIKGIHNVFG